MGCCLQCSLSEIVQIFRASNASGCFLSTDLETQNKHCEFNALAFAYSEALVSVLNSQYQLNNPSVLWR